MTKSKTAYFLVILMVLGSCGIENTPETRFELLPASKTGIDFNNRLSVTDDFNVLDFDYIYNGAGVAVGDFNNDGLPDIFFAGNMVSSRLYLNEGEMKFKDITAAAKVGTETWAEGVTLIDINNDGWLDIYVSVSNRDPANPNPNLLFVNIGQDENGIPIFEEKAEQYGIADRGYNTQAAFFDYDRDGYLDLYILSNALESFQRNTSRPRELTGKGKSNDKLYRNNGDGTFTNVTQQAGILTEGYGLGLAITDIDQDGWPDIYVANDFISNDIFYINNGDGTFTNKIATMMDHQSFNAMGVDVADFNNDGLADVMVLDMLPPDNLRQKTMFAATENYDLYMANLERGYEPQYVRNTLQLNRGDGTFSEIGQLANVHQTDWSWGPLFADFDNDGYRDLFISNGYGKDITDLDYINFSQNLGQFQSPAERRKLLLEGISKLKEVNIPNYVFRNKGDLTFQDMSVDWGIVHTSISNGIAYADLDNDGDLDLIINNLNEEAFIYQNQTLKKSGENPPNSNFIKFQLMGDSLNLQGIGTKLKLKVSRNGKEETLYHEHFQGRGYKSFVDANPHFGLGEIEKITEVRVIWPDGKSQVLQNVPGNQTVVLRHSQSEYPHDYAVAAEHNPIFEEVSSELGIFHVHQHQTFKDFNRQRLLPHKHSENGPGLAIGDINGDGLEDFFVGGSAGFPGKLFIQDQNESFREKLLTEETVYDDMGALFFDADNDGDLDLYVVSGGSRHYEKEDGYQDRLYLNDGRGNFTQDSLALPDMRFSGSVVTAADIDGDGDLDLFVGGRVRPGSYPLDPPSAILRNEGGNFVNVTEEVCPELLEAGMVTAALWTDFDQDGKVDLILVGEWMPIRFFKQSLTEENKIRFLEVSSQIAPEYSNGWWNSIISIDIDQNGELAYVLGNLGLNTRWKASREEPLSIYAKDFDGNESIDPILFQYLKGEKYAVPGRDAMISQIPSWRNRFLVYATYASTSYNEFFLPEAKVGMVEKKAFHLGSALMRKMENGAYGLENLPVVSQFSPVYGLVEGNFKRNNSNILMIGNFYGNETITGRNDAGKGVQLSTSKANELETLSPNDSGFRVAGEGRSMGTLMGRDGNEYLIATQHADSLKVFQVTDKKELPKIIKLDPLDFKATINLKNGKTKVREFYYGSGYLSQSSRFLIFEDTFEQIEILDYQGNSRIVYP